MAILDRDRKILWARSGNLCAICRRLLVEEGTEVSRDSVVGDEAHIIGEKPTAARGHLGLGRNDLDECSNLILLCKVHHKLVDDQPETYSVEHLINLKAKHERWVKDTLCMKRSNKHPRFILLPRIQSGKELIQIISNGMALLLDHDEPEDEEELRLIGDFLQNVRDFADCWGDMEPTQHVEARFSLSKEIKEIEKAEFQVFGTTELRKMRVGEDLIDWRVVIISVVRKTHKGITELGALAALIDYQD